MPADLGEPLEREMVRVNVDALHHLTGAFLPGMVRRGAGSVLNVASLAGNQPLPQGATYSATKAFVTAFSQALHAELHGTGVSVTALCPGPVPTEFADVAGIPDVYATLPGFVQVSAADVARAGVRAMERGQRVVTPGLVSKDAAIGGRFVPRSVFLPIAEKVTRDRMVSRS